MQYAKILSILAMATMALAAPAIHGARNDGPTCGGTPPPAENSPPPSGTTPPGGTSPPGGTTPPGGTSPPGGTTPPGGTSPPGGTPPTEGTPPATSSPPADGTPPGPNPGDVNTANCGGQVTCCVGQSGEAIAPSALPTGLTDALVALNLFNDLGFTCSPLVELGSCGSNSMCCSDPSTYTQNGGISILSGTQLLSCSPLALL